MELHFSDIGVFVAFIAVVMAVSLFKSRKSETGEDYFLAGRGLTWWLIGFSLIAANISTEQFVGMSGNAASHVGLAIASYEWMAAITLVVVAFGFLPYFLRAGIFTMPEFLEVRFNSAARTIMAVATILIYMLLLGSVTYSGALTISTLAGKMGYDVSLLYGSLGIGLIAMIYVGIGGLRACAWADLIQGSALIIGGAVIMIFAFDKLGAATQAAQVVDVDTGVIAIKSLAPDTGAIERFWDLNRVRMNMFLPSTDNVLPWTALLLGLWIPNFYYWGLNQYITQRTLGSASLAQGQRGIVFAAFLKLLIPFVIVIPGIIAFNLYSDEIQLEAATDNGPILSRYLEANPATKLVEKADAPDDAAVRAWGPGRYLIALYDREEAMGKVEARNPYVLPMLRSKHEQVRAETRGAIAEGGFYVFESEDKAWATVNGPLAAEMAAYNEKTKAAAKAAGGAVTAEKPIVYKYDTALGQLLGHVLPKGVGLLGFVLAALLGAVVSSLAAMLNAASTIFSIDIFKKYIAPEASQGAVVLLGRICVVVFTAVAVFLAPQLGNPKISNSIFTIIQESQGFISPGILSVFIFGFLVRRAPPMAGWIGLVTNIVSYGILKLALPDLQFLNRMAVCFGLCLAVMAIVRVVRPLAEPVVFEAKTTIALESSRGARLVGIGVVILTLILYLMFSPIGLAK